MGKLIYTVDDIIILNDGENFQFQHFQEMCESTGYTNPFSQGEPAIYESGKGLAKINKEGHVREFDGKEHPEYDIFIKHFDKVKEINANLKQIRLGRMIEGLPNETKRRLPLDQGGYGTVQEQLEILVKDGLESLRDHRKAVDEKFPIDETS